MPAPPRRPPEATPPASVEDEISEFLRRAAQRRSRKQPQAPPPALAPVEEPVLAEEVPPPVGGQIARRRLESDREFQERQRRLGAEVAQADEKVEARLNQVFDHQVGQLSGRLAQGREMSDVSDAFAEAEPDRLPEAAAAGFAAMLTDAESIQQAIIINEILRRPDERW